MTDFIICIGVAALMVFVMIGAAIFCSAVVITIAEFCRDLKEDWRKRKEKKYEKNKTSEEEIEI